MASAVEREEIADRVVRGRAFEAVVWGMPVVSFDLMYQANKPCLYLNGGALCSSE